MIRRVFLITSNQVKVFEWNKKQLSSSYEFKNNEGGLQDFEFYLGASQSIASQILVELLEEDFQREKIPHVFGRDSKALIQRQITRHYRDSKYTHANIIGRDSSGRRDDEILLTCISNAEPVDNWMQLFSQYQVPIIGIWSLPLLSEELIKKIGVKHENILLVSRQMRSTLRESCFRSGRLLLSRQVKLDSDVRNRHTAEAYVSDGVEQIHKYLSNQRIIPFGSKLNIYCLLPQALKEEAIKKFEDSNILGYHFITLESLLQLYGIDAAEGSEADILFSYLCSRKFAGNDHYHPGGEKNAFHAYLFEKTIFYASTLGSLVLIAIAAFFAINAIQNQRETATIIANTDSLRSIYEANYAPYESQIESSDRVVETIAFSNRIENEANISPENFLNPLGNIFGQNRFSIIQLSALQWEKFHGNELEILRQDIWRKTTPNLTQYSEYPYNEAELNDKIPVVTLFGTVDHDDFSYRETVIIMQNFVQALQDIPQVEKLLVSKTPVDIRVTSQFSDQTGVDVELQIKSEEAYIYEIMLLLEPSEREEHNMELADNA